MENLDSKILLSSPHMGGSEKKYVNQAIEENWVAPAGRFISEFENSIERFLNYESRQVVALSSGTSAIHLGLMHLGVGENDVVLCQTLTFVASSNPIKYLGAVPVFIDSEESTWNLCPKALEEAILFYINKGSKPKAIIAVDLYGMPYKKEEISFLSKKYNIPVLEDSAESLGSFFNSRACGTFGDVSIFSFNGNKIITTGGGGALALKSIEDKQKMIFYATQAKDFAPHYEHSKLGYNYRMSNISAAIGLGQIEVLNRNIALRREMHIFYKELFFDRKVILQENPNESYDSNFWLSVILLEDKIQREELRTFLELEGIETRPVWKPMHLQPLYSECHFFGNKIAEDLFEKGLCLPSGSNLKEKDREKIKEKIYNFFL